MKQITEGEYREALLELGKNLNLIKAYKKQVVDEVANAINQSKTISINDKFISANITIDTEIGNSPLETRTMNCLRGFNRDLYGLGCKLSNLTQLSLHEFGRSRNVGPTVVKDLTDLCTFLDIQLKY